jgi:hypothetical protein
VERHQGDPRRQEGEVKTIWKHWLQWTDEVMAELPKGAEVLTVGLQNDNLYLWEQHDTTSHDLPEEQRFFRIAGTGHLFPTESVRLKYIGTVFPGDLVFHVFEKVE